jgi:hypothetical protein
LAGLALIFSVTPMYAVESAASAYEEIPKHPMLKNELVFTIGGYYPLITTNAALESSSGGAGAFINFEGSLDLTKRYLSPTASVFWRASDSWRLNAEYFSAPRSATRTLSDDLDWGDTTFPAGTTVNSSFDFSDLRLSAVYAFFRRQDKEIGIGLGLHVASIDASIEAAGSGTEAADVLAPLPVVNFYGMFALTDEWALDMSADWLSLTYGDYSGSLRNIEIDVLYQPFRHVGFGLGVRSMTINLGIDHSDWRGEAVMSFQGPTMYMIVTM